MNINQELQQYERDFERFKLAERVITHSPKEPQPPGAVPIIDGGIATSRDKVAMVCERCGSDRIVSDATAVWSVPDQRWELADILQETFCEQCGGSCWVKEVPASGWPTTNSEQDKNKLMESMIH